MTTHYRGMRWYKCDLHMHAPSDTHGWAGEARTPENQTRLAEEYAEACYRNKLEVVGITNHNFIGHDFLPSLKQAFLSVGKKYGYRIILFPGFEIEADVGKGIHVLCLFNYDADYNFINHTLSTCGVSYDRYPQNVLSKSTLRLPELIKIIQNPLLPQDQRGIVIIPHVFDDGLFDNDKISCWLQKEEYRNPDLLAVEIPKNTNSLSKGFITLFNNRDDCEPDWKRIRAIARLMSSDAKNFSSPGNNDRLPNHIGYRYTWIKMSNPSVDSLKQAFLDNESRIQLPITFDDKDNPNYNNKHFYIKSVAINNVAFLEDHETFFSPSLNCIIGGRGSGKSTLIEYLRIALKKDNPTGLDKGTLERIKRVHSTLDNNSEIKVTIEDRNGLEDVIFWKNNDSIVLDRSLPSPETYFNNIPVHFYSQQQLNALTETIDLKNGCISEATRLLSLVDGFQQETLSSLAEREADFITSFKSACNTQRQIASFNDKIAIIKQDLQDIERQLLARKEIQKEALLFNLLMRERDYLERNLVDIKVYFNSVLQDINNHMSGSINMDFSDTPNLSFFSELERFLRNTKNTLLDDIHQAFDRYIETLLSFFKIRADWAEVSISIKNAEEKFAEQCKNKGLSTDDIGRISEIQNIKKSKMDELEELKAQLEEIETSDKPDVLLGKIYSIWQEQFNIRKKAAGYANEIATKEGKNTKFIEINIKYQENEKSFSSLWRDFAPVDGRTRLGRNWENIGEHLFNFFKTSKYSSPWALLNAMVQNIEKPMPDYFNDFIEELNSYILNNVTKWETLLCSRIEDSVDMILYRPDGTTAGNISNGTLSDGQRNTAVLALLLAQNDDPLVIDQPEDDLDSFFVYSELIPMLRRIKPSKQLLFSTHSAILPVNGDAELIYAFQAKAGRGSLLAQGGLDCEPVTNAVLNIMEGTQEAFRIRQEKYNF